MGRAGPIVIFGWAIVACVGIAAACFVIYLVFLGFVIVKTGGTAGLPDVAKAIDAYRASEPIRITGRRRRVRDSAQDPSV